MFLNIITPCVRVENLLKISNSINIPKENYRWLVIFDLDELPSPELIPSNCEIYLHKKVGSIVGHAQRNFALTLLEKGHVYMNDDDTDIHPELWDNIKNLDEDFISFKQNDKNGNLRLMGDNINIGHIDSHNFIVSINSIGGIKWVINKYDGDGIFANECYQKIKSQNHLKIKYIPKVLSIYNNLRV